MAIPILAAAAAKIAAAKVAAGAAAKAAAAKAAAGAAKGAAAKGVAGAVKGAGTKAIAKEGVKSVAAKAAGAPKQQLSIGNLANKGVNTYPGTKTVTDSARALGDKFFKAHPKLDALKQKGEVVMQKIKDLPVKKDDSGGGEPVKFEDRSKADLSGSFQPSSPNNALSSQIQKLNSLRD